MPIESNRSDAIPNKQRNRLVVLMREICNSLINQARKFVSGEQIFALIDKVRVLRGSDTGGSDHIHLYMHTHTHKLPPKPNPNHAINAGGGGQGAGAAGRGLGSVHGLQGCLRHLQVRDYTEI